MILRQQKFSQKRNLIQQDSHFNVFRSTCTKLARVANSAPDIMRTVGIANQVIVESFDEIAMKDIHKRRRYFRRNGWLGIIFQTLCIEPIYLVAYSNTPSDNDENYRSQYVYIIFLIDHPYHSCISVYLSRKL